ncbi:MAG: hypothetical protein OXD36_17740, partial [Rhodobacter sp.]|nr:hypothetical protein [Rhodobacter sp.]
CAVASLSPTAGCRRGRKAHDTRGGFFAGTRADTFFAELRSMSWPHGRSDFSAGRLLNRVLLRPIIWLRKDLPDWDPGTINPEFSPPVTLDRGDIIAVGVEHIISRITKIT